ncbi:MAG: glycoside hydrolase 43 family protein [Prevotella sp.]|nr:glycoside hydrolase 43 family protein [Prevotella sp.]
MLFALLLSPSSFLESHAQSWTADNGNGTYTNPLFYDEFSDPDILRVGDDYYLAGTTMHSVPGLVILHSRDLVNWENISYCFDRFDFPDDAFALRNHQEIYGQGIWAPCIRYANGQFYIYSNINGKGLQCYTAKDIRGPWKHQNMQGRIYDLSVLFDDDGKIYAIHGYGEVHCTELKPDMSGPMEETDRIIIPEGSGVGEGHHMYKINGMYYLISTDYMPNGRTLCSRSKNIWGPYETRVITADETFGYHAAPLTQVPQGEQYRIGHDGTQFGIPAVDKDATACSNIHQGGIVQDQSGQWWALLMMDFHSIGRTTTLAPITWQDGWPMLGLEGNLGRAPRTWFKPLTSASSVPSAPSVPSVATESQQTKPHGPYNRSDDFNYSPSTKKLAPIWQWNHNPDDSKWSLKNGRLHIQAQPAEQLMWARNTLTQRVIGPKSIVTVELYTKGMKDGDICGLGNINVPCSWIGIMKDDHVGTLLLRSFSQYRADPTLAPAVVPLTTDKIWLRCIGDYDNDKMQYAYSTDGESFQTLGQEIPLSYQLITFQGSRHALFAFNCKGKKGGYAEFDNFTVVEPDADRSQNIPYGKTFRIINIATGRPMIALDHGVVHDIDPALLDNPDAERDINNRDRNTSEKTRFRIIDRGQGRVVLQCEDGRYIFVAGQGLPGDVRLTTDPDKAEVFLWQDYLNHDFMLLSLRNHRYIGKNATTGSPYSMDFTGADPARRNGAVLHWEE